ncbi:uncharacterized protein LOC134535963 [Bacillus rossius redtenbacheri]|uniref:uncharacterized protein LOC134535963 n=1 Tax=Bacillus rossius redtenbacheri TaxID=93214 RepID=UPI002FDE698B
MAGGGRPAADLLVALVAAPLLVALGLLLQSNLRGGDWSLDPRRRWHVLGLGLGLLCVSVVACCYVTRRLGACAWEARLRRAAQEAAAAAAAAGGSQLQLAAREDPPPSYEAAAASCDAPPPYCALVRWARPAPDPPPTNVKAPV